MSVTVDVADDGKVWVNDKLVAEVGAGQVDGRDDLEGQLTLHRIAGLVHQHLGDCAHALAIVDGDADRDLIGAGVADGLARLTRPATQLGHPPGVPDVPRRHEPEYRVGLEVGRTLAAALDHLNTAQASRQG